MIDLEDKYINFIKKTVSKYLNNCEIFLYGSRAKGVAKKYSDVDIALLSEELTESIKLKISAEFENSTFPYNTDIIDLNAVSKDFMKQIKNSLTKL